MSSDDEEADVTGGPRRRLFLRTRLIDSDSDSDSGDAAVPSTSGYTSGRTPHMTDYKDTDEEDIINDHAYVRPKRFFLRTQMVDDVDKERTADIIGTNTAVPDTTTTIEEGGC